MHKTAQSSVQKLVELYYQPLFHFAAQLCGDPVRAMTLTQRTFRVALERSRSLPVPTNVRAWLFTISFHQFLEARAQGQGA